jgi:DNA-binding response OmpR family regulator
MNYRILIADPDQELLESYENFLSRADFEVQTATTARDCLTKLCSFRPDVLVLEPELLEDGSEGSTDLLSNHSEMPQVPVMVVTAHFDPDNLYRVRSFRDMPVNAYYVKPLAPQELADCVRRIRKN